METYANIIKTVIPRPVLDVKVSNPFPLVGDTVTLSTLTKWVTSHRYQIDSGNGETSDNTLPAVLGQSQKTLTVGNEATLEQRISIENFSGSALSLKRIYAMLPQDLPYFDVVAGKEIVRVGETGSILVKPENGYSNTSVIVARIYKENETDIPVKVLNFNAGRPFPEGVVDNFTFPETSDRGIYDIEVDVTDTLTGVTFTKRINKLITVTPKLAARADAIEFVIPNAKKAKGPDDYTINGDNYPAGSTIVLKTDPNEPDGYPMRLKLLNFKGTWDNPYIITIDQSDPFVINWFYYWGINIGGASEHVVFDGRGYQNIKNGIKLKRLPDEDATAAFSAGELSQEIEAFNIEIDGTSFAGFFIKTDPDINRPETWYGNFNFNRLLLHHNYIHDTDCEGCYLGHYSMSIKKGNNNKGQYVEYRAHHLYNCRVYRNEFINNGYDSLQFNNAENLDICYNRFVNSGYRNEPDQTSCMSLGLSGKIYNNVCLNYSGSGIQFSTLGRLDIYNNIMANGTETGGSLYLLASEDTPEQNPNGQGYNELPLVIHNNLLMSKRGGGLGARNTTQYRDVRLIDNFIVTGNGELCGGQNAETVAMWKAAAKGNVVITQKVDDYPALDDAYLFGDSAGGDYRITSNSPLIKDGSGDYFKFDHRGYKNWYGSVYPVGPFMGITQLQGMDETFRILTLTLDDGAYQTISGLVSIKWTAYGNIPVTACQVSGNVDFAGAEWIDCSAGTPVTYQLTGDKGIRTVYVRLKNANNQVTEGKYATITWTYRTALIAVMASGAPAGVFNSQTGIHYLRISMSNNVPFKDTLGNNMGVINSVLTKESYTGEGLTTGDNSGIYPDVVLQKNGYVGFGANSKEIDDPLVVTLQNLKPGKYKVSIFVNSNRNLDTSRFQSHLDIATPYFKYKANDVENNAIKLYKNFDTLVDVGEVQAGDDGLITITAYWDPEVANAVPTAPAFICGGINLIKLEEY